jgi:hypothetical protein
MDMVGPLMAPVMVPLMALPVVALVIETAVLPDEAPEQNVGEPATPVEGDVA